MSEERLRARGPALELGAMTLLLTSYIWLWQEAFPGHFQVVLLAFGAIGIAAARRRGDTPRSLGFRLDNLGPAALQALIWIGPLVVATLAAGVAMDAWRTTSAGDLGGRLLEGVLWGTAQQYGLNGFYLRGFRQTLRGPRAPIVAAALTFAAFHLPNPFLTIATFATGLLAGRIYTRTPNLWVLGVAHAVLALAFHAALPTELTGAMRVGPGYLRW